MIMRLPLSTWVNTVHLRTSYLSNDFLFGNAASPIRVCLVGSCRILPYLNYLRVYNHYAKEPFELICLNPVECWNPGEPVAKGVNARMQGYQLGEVDWLICEHVLHCGVMNTVEEAEENVFKNLGCKPKHPPLRIPNWVYMFIYDNELAHIEKDYAALTGYVRIDALRKRTEKCKADWLDYCRQSSFPELVSWCSERWTSHRIGWTGNHISGVMTLKIFELIARQMGITITPQMASHQHFTLDQFASTGIKLTTTDFAANHWTYED